MAIRTFEIELTNASDFTLIKTLDHLCHGIWTHQPPDSIPSGATVLWKSESGGDLPIIGNIATGTEGVVKYRIEGNGDTVYIHWDNPFALGTTTADGKVSAEDINVDVDHCQVGDSGDSAFAPPPTMFELFKTFEGGGPGTDLDEPFGFLEINPILTPILVLGNTGIVEHMKITLTFAEKTNSLRTFALRRRIDLSKGLRSRLTPGSVGAFSLRSIMGL